MTNNKNPLAAIIADPSAMGLYGFAVVTLVAGSLHCKWYSNVDNGMFAPALCYGGVAQIIAGLIDLLRGVKIGGSTFVAFGLYWFAQGLWMIPSNSLGGLYEDMSEVKKIKGTFILGYALVALATTLAELKSNIVKIVLLSLVTIDFTGLAIVCYTENEPFEKVVGYILVATAILAWYLGTAHFFEDGVGPFDLPIGRLGGPKADKSHETITPPAHVKTIEDTV